MNNIERIINYTIQHYDFNITFEEALELVIEDYEDSDITKLTINDVVEILEASGVE